MMAALPEKGETLIAGELVHSLQIQWYIHNWIPYTSRIQVRTLYIIIVHARSHISVCMCTINLLTSTDAISRPNA